MKLYAVTRERGPAWDHKLSRQEQKRWAGHASFMDQLAEEGFVVFGGPLGDEAKSGFSKALLIFKAENEGDIRKRLDADPWTATGLLRISAIEPWEILLGESRLQV